MSRSQSPTRYRTIMDHQDPRDLPDKDLLNMPLKTLKSITTNSSSRQTIKIYLRWLEIHRQERSNLSEHWSNTLLHWSQSLKSRGFEAYEIIEDVEEWKERMKKEHGPFRSYERRYPPSPADIRRAFADDEKDKENKKPVRASGNVGDEFAQPPPKGYICNRCGKRGHYLQVCPTNLDPAYDKPPDDKYVCTCCQARGQHYRSLCPRNTDPYCIYQRRRAQGIVTPGIDSSDYDSQKEFDRMRGEKRERGRDSEYSNASTPDKKARLQELEEQAKWLVSEEIADVDEAGLLPLGTVNAFGSHKREFAASSNGREKFRKTGDAELISSPTVGHSNKNVDNVNYRQNPAEFAVPKVEPADSPSNQPHEQKRDRKFLVTSQLSDSDSESPSKIHADMTTPPPLKSKKQYCSFVRQLLKKHPEMKETVNQIKTRPAGVDMIQQDFERQLEHAKLVSRSPTPIRREPKQSRETTPHMPTLHQDADSTSRSASRESESSDPKEYAQFDGAFDEKPEGCNKTNPRRNNKLTCFGKGAIGKVKSITKDFPAFKPKSCSASPDLANGSPATGSQSRLFPFSSWESTKKPLSEKSPNRKLVPAITSALKLTSPTFESLQEDSRALLKPDTPTDSIRIPELVAVTPSIQSPHKRNTPTYRTSKSLHSASTESFEILDEEARRPFNPRPFEGLHKRRGASVTPSRSIDEFRHTVRKILIQGTKADEFRTFSKTFKLSTPMPTDIAALTGNDTTSFKRCKTRGAELSIDDTDGSDSEGTFLNREDNSYNTILSKTNDLRAAPIAYEPETPVSHNKLLSNTLAEAQSSSGEAQSVARFWRDVEYTKKLRTLANEREFIVRKNDLKHFAETFKLPTPMPSDIAALTSGGRPAMQMELPRQQSCEILQIES